MKFGSVPVADAEGAVLAHAVQVGARRLKKGHVLTTSDVGALAAQHDTLIVAQLEPTDVSEDAAAGRLAEALAMGTDGTNIRADAPFTGRANLYATATGLFDTQRCDVDAFNAIDPAITLATLPPGTCVAAGRMVATVKIIPLAVDAPAVACAEALARDASMISVHPPQDKRVVLIQTVLPTTKASVLDKTARVLGERLARATNAIADEVRVGHEVGALTNALCALERDPQRDAERELIIIFGASAIADEDDVIPAAVRAAGGAVLRVGMPVDPGNLLMLAQLGGRMVIGAPGCARSPAENGFDWVLQRATHGAHLDGDLIASWGVGGLLMEITDRPQPREAE